MARSYVLALMLIVSGGCFAKYTKLIAQEFEDSSIPTIVEAASTAWKAGLDLACEFEYREFMFGSDEVIAKGRGFIAVRSDVFRLKIEWEAIDERGTKPYQDFDFCSHDGVDLWIRKSCRLKEAVNPFSIKALNDLGRENRTINAADEFRIYQSGVEPITRRYPIAEIPTVIGFCGGWNNGVAFGGLETHANNSQEAKAHFDQFGLMANGPMALSVERDSDDEVTIRLTKNLAESKSTLIRDSSFASFDGLLLKTSERFEMATAQGEVIHSKLIEVSDFSNRGGLPFPSNLTVAQLYTPFGDKQFIRSFEIVNGSIRESEDTDFSVPATKISPDYRHLVGSDGCISLLEIDLGFLQGKPEYKQEISPQLFDEQASSSSAREVWRNSIFIILVAFSFGVVVWPSKKN